MKSAVPFKRTALDVPHKIDYSFFLPAALTFAHRALAAAAILARPAALILCFFFAGALAAVFPLTFAHRAF